MFGSRYGETVIEGRRKEEGGHVLAILWAISLHRNEVMFRGRLASTGNVFHEVEGQKTFWFPQAPEGDGGMKQG